MNESLAGGDVPDSSEEPGEKEIKQGDTGAALDAGPPMAGELIVLVGAAVALVGSFLPAYKIDEDELSVDWNAWSNSFNLFPLAALSVLFLVAVGVEIAISRWAPSVRLPEHVFGYRRQEARIVVAALAAVTFLGFTLRNFENGRGAGLWTMLAGAVLVTVGSLITWREQPHLASGPPPDTPTPATLGTAVVGVSGAVALIGSFLDFYRISATGFLVELAEEFGSTPIEEETLKIWSWNDGFFLLAALPVLAAALAAVLAIADSAARLPGWAAGSPGNRLRATLGVYASVAMVSFLVSDPVTSIFGITIDADRLAGFWLVLAGSLGVVVGCFMHARQVGSTSAPR